MGKTVHNRAISDLGTPEQKLAVAVIMEAVDQVNDALKARQANPTAHQAARFLCGNLGEVDFWLSLAGVKNHDRFMAGCHALGKRYLEAATVTKKRPAQRSSARRAAVCL